MDEHEQLQMVVEHEQLQRVVRARDRLIRAQNDLSLAKARLKTTEPWMDVEDLKDLVKDAGKDLDMVLGSVFAYTQAPMDMSAGLQAVGTEPSLTRA